MDYSLPGSSVRGISQARILEWDAISFSTGSSWLRDQTCISCIGRRILYHWATREASESRFKPKQFGFRVWAGPFMQKWKSCYIMINIRHFPPHPSPQHVSRLPYQVSECKILFARTGERVILGKPEHCTCKGDIHLFSFPCVPQIFPFKNQTDSRLSDISCLWT